MQDRLHAAGYVARVARENVALNRDVTNAHQSLMESPSHRESILAGDVTVAGIGIIESNSDIHVTQLFATPARQVEAREMRQEMIDRIGAARGDAGLSSLAIHRDLQEVADAEIERISLPLDDDSFEPASEEALKVARRDRSLSGVVVAAQTALEEKDLSPTQALLDPAAISMGVSVRMLRQPGEPPVFLVLVILGTR